MKRKFSVLMSLYIKEKPEFLRDSINSVLNQTVLPDEIVIVFDGPITEELEKTVDEYTKINPDLYTIVHLKENRGLGLALAEGMLHCKNELVARMDTDDVCHKERFEKQLAEFEKDPELDICGSQIAEFEDNINEIVARRTVPLKDAEIKEYQKRRDGLNHVSVMFKRDTVFRAGNYQSCLLMEDTLLWANMFNIGAKVINIDEDLVFVRIGKDMYERRGGFAYFKKYAKGRKKVKETGYIGLWDYYYTLIIQFIVAMIPNCVRGWIFKKLLHR